MNDANHDKDTGSPHQVSQSSAEQTTSTSSTESQTLDPLIVSIHTTSGTVPAPVAGASFTVIGDRLWVFGGRLVSNRRMINELYSLDLDEYVWRRHVNLPGDSPPEGRYFHSADAYGDKLVLFGGMGQRPVQDAQGHGHDTSVVYSDIVVLDVSNPDQPRWQRPQVSGPTPRPRYAHLTAVNGQNLVVIGGQDLQNTYVEDVLTFDLDTYTWTRSAPFPKHCGAYRSIALCYAGSTYVYSNYNFIDVRRELQVLGPDLHLTDRSRGMTGENRPPGLRFPTGHLIGDYLVVSGTFLTVTAQTFTIWLLNMNQLVWAPLECSRPLHKGSWNRSVLDTRRNRHLVLGNTDRQLLGDYEQRRVNFTHVAAICLESYGVYDVPWQRVSVLGQELGTLLLDRRQFSDFEIRVPDDTDRTVVEGDEPNGGSNGFASPRHQQRQIGTNGVTLSPNSNGRHPLDDDDEAESSSDGGGGCNDDEDDDDDSVYSGTLSASPRDTYSGSAPKMPTLHRQRSLDGSAIQPGERVIYVNSQLLRKRWPYFSQLVAIASEGQPQPVRYLRLPEPYSVVRQLLHYLYSGALDPSSTVEMIGQLMVAGRVYKLHDLMAQTAHILHGRLNIDTAIPIFLYASQAKRNGLCVRALRTMRNNADLLSHSVSFWMLPESTRQHIYTYLPATFPRTVPAYLANALATASAAATAAAASATTTATAVGTSTAIDIATTHFPASLAPQ